MREIVLPKGWLEQQIIETRKQMVKWPPELLILESINDSIKNLKKD